MPDALKNALNSLSAIDGFIAASFVELDTGMTLDSTLGGEDFDIEVAGAINTNVVQAKLRALRALGLVDKIEDIVVTLSTQYHLMRIVPERPGVFLYVVLDRGVANMALARRAMAIAADAVVSDLNEPIAPAVARLVHAVPSYPRTYLKRPAKGLTHNDSPPRGFPRGRGNTN